MTQNKNQLKQPLLASYQKTPEQSVSFVFKLRPEDLELFFEREHLRKPDNKGERRECLKILEKVEWTNGLLRDLVTNQENGITGDVKDIARRQKFFGVNTRSLPTVRTFWAILKDQFDEFYMQVLIVLGAACLALSFFSEAVTWVDATSIFFAVFFAGFIQTLCDWGKEAQFLRLQDEIKNDKVNVLRGQRGITQTIFTKDLVVGDIVLLNQGDRVPADCLLVRELDMKVDQKQFYPDVEGAEMTSKQCSYEDENDDIETNPDNILLQDSIVMRGSGKAVILAVGKHTLKEREMASQLKEDKYALQIENKLTPFQKRLEIIAEIIGTYAKLLCVFSLILFGVIWLLHVIFGDKRRLVDEISIHRAIDLACTVAALLAVCIPEGMPLVISMAMAFSVQSLKNENLLIKNLDGLETSGQIDDVVTGKTGTLTEGDMTVEVLHSQGVTHLRNNLQMQQSVLQDFKTALILNSAGHMQMNTTLCKYVPSGSPVEVGLLNFAASIGLDIYEKMIARENESKFTLCAWLPFASERQCMTVAYIDHSYDENLVKVIMKGSPESVLSRCTKAFDQYGQENPIEVHHTMQQIEREVILHEDDGQPMGLKAISFAQKILDRQIFTQNLDFENEENRRMLESDLTYIGTVGLSDPMREGVTEAVLHLEETKTNVRIFSGDHEKAVIATAIQLDMKDSLDQTDDVMEGNALLNELKERMVEEQDTEEGRGVTYVFRSVDQKKWFKDNIKKQIRFVYRSTPEVRHMFTAAMRQCNTIVGVTGEGLGDARALSEANVGFTMGMDGCDAAKDHCDIIMMDDQFDTLVSAIRFGRNIQDNVRKFVQFQLTVNLTTMVFVIVNTVILGHSPLNVVQLLWINLIMDVLAAIAFSTEAPPDDIKRDKVKASDRLVTQPMMRSIIFQSAYQIIALFLVLYLGPSVGGYQYDLFRTEMYQVGPDGERHDTYRCLHQTFIFHCLVTMTLFNMVNCRLVDPIPKPVPQINDGASQEEIKEIVAANRGSFNIFQRPFSNFWFWLIFVGEFNIEFFIVGYKAVGNFFNTTPMYASMHFTALGLGIGTWIVGTILKLTGTKLVNAMPQFGEDQAALDKAKNFSKKAGKFVPRGHQSQVTVKTDHEESGEEYNPDATPMDSDTDEDYSRQ